MLNKTIALFLVLSVAAASQPYKGSTMGPVVIAGAIIKASHEVDDFKKYRRKDCPVCKGTGKYLSGDGIKMVDCGYCEPEKSAYTETIEETKNISPIIVVPKSASQPTNNAPPKTVVNEAVTVVPCPTCKPPVIRNINPTYRR